MRDTSRDGSVNRIEDYVLSHFRWFWLFVMAIPPLRRWVNRTIINRACSYGETRPRPFSSMPPRGDERDPSILSYTSWESLTDQRWFSRHLPAKEMTALPPVEEVRKLFEVGSRTPVISKQSSLLFPAFAQWFTDGFLMTDANDTRRTFSHHQIDFNPLYGLTREQTVALRLCSEAAGQKGFLKVETRGDEVYAPKLYEDGGNVRPAFSVLRPPLGFDDYLKTLPPLDAIRLKRSIFAFGGERANSTPYTAMLNTLFLREHNRIAAELQKENTGWDDERVFQTARNINMVLLIKIVVEEYINHIAPQYFRLTADPSVCWSAPWNKPIWVPIEFNLLYRWHSLSPDRFEIGGRTYDPQDVIFNTGLLMDTGLGELMEAASRQRAWELGLFNTPGFLLFVEARSVLQGRTNKVGSYNDYREAFKFPRVTRFEQITDDLDRIDALRKLYGEVDNIEFFVGLFAEPILPLGALPSLLKRIVAFDAFSMALTNPLLSEHVFNETTFTKSGMSLIAATGCLQDILNRNLRPGQKAKASMDYALAA